jgi:hypothetical protein
MVKWLAEIMMAWLLGGVLLFPTITVAEPVRALFGTDARGGNLIKIDQTTGAGTVVGPMGIGVVPALAIDPTTGAMYAATGAGNPNLYTVNSATAATALVGSTRLGFAAVGDMAFRADGTLYAAVNITGDGGTGSDHLATINKATGVATVIGPFGSCTPFSCTIEGIEAIAFDASGRLWGALSERGRSGTPGLYKIDPTTGLATFFAPILDAVGVPPSGGVVSLQSACDGRFFGGTATAIFPAGDGGRLITIEPATGLFKFVGSVSATRGSSLGALALQGPCNDIVKIQFAQLYDLSGSPVLFVSATSTAAPRAKLAVTVPGCLTNRPMDLEDGQYVFEGLIPECSNIALLAFFQGAEAVVTVTSDFGGSASVPMQLYPPFP